MVTTLRLAACLGLLAATTACHGECYTVRSADASGRFGDTLVAVSGARGQPGTALLRINEQIFSNRAERYADIDFQAPSTIDTVSLVRLTFASDPNRIPRHTETRKGIVVISDGLFETLFVRLATEDVLFEVVGKNGTVVKALLNLEDRTGPKEACYPYT